jgi:putative membrane protein
MEEITTPFRNNRSLQLMVGWLALVWGITAIHPLYPFDWFLENLLTYIYGAILILTFRRFKFTNLSYALFTLYLTLHMIGAHYTYAKVPLGFWAQEWFGFTRNHYDRLVHFAFGFLLAVPFRELLVRIVRIPLRWSYFMTACVMLAFSAFYELLEMWTAIIVSPELGDAYLGTQGDVWDSQQDMFVAFLGSVITMSAVWLANRRVIRLDASSSSSRIRPSPEGL